MLDGNRDDMPLTDPTDGGTRNPFAGTPPGGQPHWFARPGSRGPFDGQVADAIHNTARAAAWSSVFAAGVTYAHTRDSPGLPSSRGRTCSPWA
jgi:hypothetical protein